MRRFHFVCLVYALLAAPATAQAPADALVELRITADTRAGHLPVTAQTLLRKGDKLRIDLRARYSVYVYIIHVSPQGTASLLYASRSHPMAAGTRLVLPKTGAYNLDAEVGRETIAIIASEAALDSASPEHARIVRTVEREHRLPTGSSAIAAEHRATQRARPEPAGATPAQGAQDLYGNMRGLSDLPTAVAVRGDNGVAVASVQLNHVK
jgi:hypothetical protein